MAVRKTIQIGDAKLKAENEVVVNFSNLKIKRVIKDLKDTMRKNDLIGMAAPQIGENYKLFITQPRKTKARKLSFTDKVRVYINPKVTKFSEKKNIIYEGCGSVLKGNLFGPVERPRELTIQAWGEDGKKFQLQCNGILARVIQHEYDHLFGIEFTEKIYDYKKLMAKEFYIKNIRNSKEQLAASKVTVLKSKNLT
ncbi:peptide deformylase [Candidatus Woesebacteria bacterium RBG_16_34_12]|uniref:Peptide deformylase n=1 Tax=Candidatus Woesebacteria bacterium RBG_16_34_12 TaxID=1802480 RepID=A0A1F7XAQ1_9BACT|nr:MAG: peptide deformylase [Candidatus Woesebacteria bacterium RBG_16_34_12]